MILTLIVATIAMTGGEFSTGGAEFLKFKGYLISTFSTYGEEDADPDNGFNVIATVEWLPQLNDWVDARVAFKSQPAKYTGSFEDLSLTTEDILINMHFNDMVTFSMGHFKRPFGHCYTRSGSSMYIRDRAFSEDDEKAARNIYVRDLRKSDLHGYRCSGRPELGGCSRIHLIEQHKTVRSNPS